MTDLRYFLCYKSIPDDMYAAPYNLYQ